MRHFLIAVAAFAAASPVLAQDPATLRVGQIVRDADMNKLGPVSQVNNDGSVQIIYEQHLLVLPAGTLSVVDGKAKTSLSKHDLKL